MLTWSNVPLIDKFVCRHVSAHTFAHVGTFICRPRPPGHKAIRQPGTSRAVTNTIETRFACFPSLGRAWAFGSTTSPTLILKQSRLDETSSSIPVNSIGLNLTRTRGDLRPSTIDSKIVATCESYNECSLRNEKCFPGRVLLRKIHLDRPPSPNSEGRGNATEPAPSGSASDLVQPASDSQRVIVLRPVR